MLVSFNAAEQSSINSLSHVTCNRTKVSARPYAATARFTRSFRVLYIFFDDGWSTPVTPCWKNDFWRCVSFFSPDMKAHMVGWWHRRSDCIPWCHPSTKLVLQAMLSTSAACWFQDSVCYYQLRCIRPYLDSTTASTIATSIVHSKLDYCNSRYYNLLSLRLPASNKFRTLLPVRLSKLLNPVTSLLSYALFTGSK